MERSKPCLLSLRYSLCVWLAAEEYFTSRSMGDVKELKDNNPDFALVLGLNGDQPPHFSSLTYKKVPVHDLEVDSYILVKAGEVCEHTFARLFLFIGLFLTFCHCLRLVMCDFNVWILLILMSLTI